MGCQTTNPLTFYGAVVWEKDNLEKNDYKEKLALIRKDMVREVWKDTILPVFYCPQCGACYNQDEEALECCNSFEVGERVVVLFGPFTERHGTISSIGKEGKYGVVLETG